MEKKYKHLVLLPGGEINISRCTELQNVLWDVTPGRRAHMRSDMIHLRYEDGMKYIDKDAMSEEEKEVLAYVIEKHGLLLP